MKSVLPNALFTASGRAPQKDRGKSPRKCRGAMIRREDRENGPEIVRSILKEKHKALQSRSYNPPVVPVGG